MCCKATIAEISTTRRHSLQISSTGLFHMRRSVKNGMKRLTTLMQRTQNGRCFLAMKRSHRWHSITYAQSNSSSPSFYVPFHVGCNSTNEKMEMPRQRLWQGTETSRNLHSCRHHQNNSKPVGPRPVGKGCPVAREFSAVGWVADCAACGSILIPRSALERAAVMAIVRSSWWR